MTNNIVLFSVLICVKYGNCYSSGINIATTISFAIFPFHVTSATSSYFPTTTPSPGPSPVPSIEPPYWPTFIQTRSLARAPTSNPSTAMPTTRTISESSASSTPYSTITAYPTNLYGGEDINVTLTRSILNNYTDFDWVSIVAEGDYAENWLAMSLVPSYNGGNHTAYLRMSTSLLPSSVSYDIFFMDKNNNTLAGPVKIYINNPCPTSFTYFPPGCYWTPLSGVEEPYDIAEIDCQNRGGYLATVTTPAERNNVKTNVATEPYFFIGLRRVDGNWEWPDGSPLEFSSWKNDAPDAGNDCVYSDKGKWYGSECTVQRSYMCEADTLKTTQGPTSSPTGTPTAAPSISPAPSSSAVPSAVPTTSSASPTSFPTAIPSVVPSAAPSSPTTYPSSVPSASPSISPTLFPSAVPSAVPTTSSASPTSFPTAIPSFGPTASSASSTLFPTAFPSAVSSFMPGTMPSVKPSGHPSVPIVYPIRSPSSPSLRIPTFVPTPTSSPNSVPTVIPLPLPGATPTTQPSAAHTSAPTDLLTPILTAQPSTSPSFAPSRKPIAPIAVTLVNSVVQGGMVHIDLLSIQWGNLSVVGPVSSVKVDFWCELISHNGSAASVIPFLPTSYTIQSTAPQKTFRASIPASLEFGTYRLAFTVHGLGADRFEVRYLAGSEKLTVVNPDDRISLAPPNLTLAQYANSGAHVLVSFSMRTDQARLPEIFSCDQLFLFTESRLASCIWVTDSDVAIYPSSAHRLVVGKIIFLRANRLRSRCMSSGISECSHYPTTPSQNVLVLPPANPTEPEVVTSAPSAIGPCTSFKLDLTASTGHMYADWTSLSSIVVSYDGSVDAELTAFFASDYKFNPATAIPATRLHTTGTYTFSIQLCNVFNMCSSSYVHDLEIRNSVQPVVSIAGGRSRSVLRSEPLKLYSSAYIEQCSGIKSSSELTYNWMVMENGVRVAPAGLSLSKSVLTLPRGTLNVGSVYRVVMAVTHMPSGAESTSAPVHVTVQAGDLKATIVGSTTRSIRVGDAMTLDASGSSDADWPQMSASDAGLSFEWSCSLVDPLDLNACPFFLSSTTKSILTISVANSTSINEVAKLTLRVFDSTRFRETSVQVTVLPALSPLTDILTSGLVILPNSKVKIRGLVTLQSPETASWSVDNKLVNLSDISITPTVSNLFAGDNLLNLVIKPNSLSPRQSFTFMLTCGDSSASVLIQVAGAPVPGMFNVYPMAGVELVDDFQFSTSMWSDDFLPITYLFGVRTLDGSLMVLQSRSEFNSVSSMLPSGPERYNFNVTCVVQALNTVNAMEELQTVVRVTKALFSADDFDVFLEKELQFASNQTNTDAVKRVIASGIGTLNSANCSLAPACAGLRRGECGGTAHTCGKCVDGYFGESGEANSACYPGGTTLNDNMTSCTSDSECGLFRVCNLTNELCVRPSKSCRGACDMHGSCEMRLSSSNALVSSCLVGDPSCFAQCSCRPEYAGVDCQSARIDVFTKSQSRSRVIAATSNVVKTAEAELEDFEGFLGAAVELAKLPEELTTASCVQLLDVVRILLGASSSLVLPYDSILDFSVVISNCISVYVRLPERAERDIYLYGAREMQVLHAAMILADVEVGQNSVDITRNLYRMSLNRISPPENSTSFLRTPSTPEEMLYGVQPAAIQLQTASSHNRNASSVTVIESASQLNHNELRSSIGNVSSTVISSAIKVELSDFTLFDDNIRITIASQRKTDFYIDPSKHQTFLTVCNGSSTWQDDFTCYNGFVIFHNCSTGRRETMASTCPWRAVQPACALVIDGSVTLAPTTCAVESYSSYAVTCDCSLSEVKSLSRRQLSASNEAGLVEVCAISEYLYQEIPATVVTAQDLKLSDLRGSLLVILMYSLLWVSVLLIVGFLSATDISGQLLLPGDVDSGGYRRRSTRRTAPPSGTHLSSPTKTAEVHSYLMKYIDMIIPVVFRPRQSYSKSFFEEIAKHHRYIKIFSTKGGHSDEVRIRTAVQMLTVLSMVFFIMAMFFELEYPRDDGSCAEYSSEYACLRENSPFDKSESKCKWVESDTQSHCKYNPVRITLMGLVVLVGIIAVCTAPANFLIDFLFDSILAAPTKDDDTVRVDPRTDGFLLKLNTESGGSRRDSSRQAKIKQQSSTMSKVVSFKSSFFLDQEAIKLPKAVVKSHALVIAAIRSSAAGATARFCFEAKDFGGETLSVDTSGPLFHLDHTQTVLDAVGGAAYSIDRFMKELKSQREALDPRDRDRFDLVWGIDSLSGQFLDERDTSESGCCGLGRDSTMTDILAEEIANVREQALLKIIKLRSAPDIHCGLECFHLFLLDLLGRDTPAAKIFQYKMEEEFGHATVVTKFAKRVAWVCIALLNVFFIGFTILQSIDRDMQWQRGFVLACLLQMIVEVTFFETTECLWIHFQMPRLVQSDVEDAVRILYRSLEFALANDGLENIILDVPQYLFVSTQVAKHFGRVFECAVVRFFQTILGGQIVKKIREKTVEKHISRRTDTWWMVTKRFFSSVSMMTIMLFVATLPVQFQRLVVHSLQPVVLAGLILLCSFIFSYPWIATFPALFVAYVVYLHLKREAKSRRDHHRVDLVTNTELLSRRSTSAKSNACNTSVSPRLATEMFTGSSVCKGSFCDRSSDCLDDERDESDVKSEPCFAVQSENESDIILADADACQVDGELACNGWIQSDSDIELRDVRKKKTPFLFKLFSLESFMSENYDESDKDKVQNGHLSAVDEISQNECIAGCDSSCSDEESVGRPRRAYRGIYSLPDSDVESNDDDVDKSHTFTSNRVVRNFVRMLSGDRNEYSGTNQTKHCHNRKNGDVTANQRRRSWYQQMFELEAENYSNDDMARTVRGDVAVYSSHIDSNGIPAPAAQHDQICDLVSLESTSSEFNVEVRVPNRAASDKDIGDKDAGAMC